MSPSLFALMIEPLAIALHISPKVKALEVGGISECIALYADNMILFLQNSGPSLRVVFDILSTFARFSGPNVNWTKSSVMAIDAGAQSLVNHTIPIMWVTKFTYLGIKISPRVGDYMSLNVLPLTPMVKCRLEAWQNLSLSLGG